MCAVALFASLVGPFGGFIASGIKRAYDIKDFASVIPGHGGLMDRMDCQMLTGMFVSVYLTAVVFPESSVDEATANLAVAASGLSLEDKRALVESLQSHLLA